MCESCEKKEEKWCITVVRNTAHFKSPADVGRWVMAVHDEIGQSAYDSHVLLASNMTDEKSKVNVSYHGAIFARMDNGKIIPIDDGMLGAIVRHIGSERIAKLDHPTSEQKLDAMRGIAENIFKNAESVLVLGEAVDKKAMEVL